MAPTTSKTPAPDAGTPTPAASAPGTVDRFIPAKQAPDLLYSMDHRTLNREPEGGWPANVPEHAPDSMRLIGKDSPATGTGDSLRPGGVVPATGTAAASAGVAGGTDSTAGATAGTPGTAGSSSGGAAR